MKKMRRLIRNMPAGERPQERLRLVGPRGLAAAELLAIILGTADALDVARELLAEAGSVYDLYRLSLSEMEEIDGIGPATAARIRAAQELGRRMMLPNTDTRYRITCPADAANYLMPDMSLLEQETLRVILLDTRNHVMGDHLLYMGNANTSIVRVSEVFRHAIKANAVAIVVAHNHPSGDASPSPEDVAVTRQIVKSGKLLDIEVLDHIIIGRTSYVSLKERGLGFG